MLDIRDATNFRRNAAGIGLVAAPLSFAAADVIRLSIEGGADGQREQLAAIASQAGLWQIATLLNIVAVILFVPAVLGLAHLLRERHSVLANVGGALAMIGLLGWAAHYGRYFGFMGAASTSDIAPADMVAFIDHWVMSPDTVIYVLMFLLAWALGLILLAVGVYRARITPRWAAAAFLSGAVLWLVVGFTPVSESVFAVGAVLGVWAAGLGAIGMRVLSMSDADWERAPQIVHSDPVRAETVAQAR